MFKYNKKYIYMYDICIYYSKIYDLLHPPLLRGGPIHCCWQWVGDLIYSRQQNHLDVWEFWIVH